MENTDNIKFSDLMRGRVVSKTVDMTITKIEKDYLHEIFTKNEKILKKFPDTAETTSKIQLINRGFYYDTYIFYYNNKPFCLKLGDKEDFYIFNKENKALKKTYKSGSSLKPVLLDESELYSFLITELEVGTRVEQIGAGAFMTLMKPFGEALFKMHANAKFKKGELKIFLDKCLSLGDFDEIFGPEIIEEFKKIEDFESYKQVLNFIKKTLTVQLEDIEEENVSLCHLNLNQSNILIHGETFKFLDFQNSFKLNPCWDLAMASVKLGIHNHPIREDEFLKSYDLENFIKNKTAVGLYKELCCKLILHNIICIYFIRLAFPKENTELYELFIDYETIRPLIYDEFEMHIPLLDKLFNDFNNI